HRAGLVLADGRLLVSLSDEDLSRAAGVLALDPVTGRTLWRVRTDSSVKNAVAAREGLFAAVSVTGEIVAGCAQTGRLAWRRRLQGHPDRWIFTSPVIHADLVVAGTAGGLEARRLETGELAWRWRFDAHTTDAWSHYAGAQVIADQLIVPVMRRGVSALRLVDGRAVWHVEGSVWYPQAGLVSDGGRVFTPLKQAVLAKIDAAAGELLACCDLGRIDRRRSVPSITTDMITALACHNRSIFSVTSKGVLRAHYAASLRVKWTAELARELYDMTPYEIGAHSAWASPLVVDDTLVLACADGALRLHDPASGRLLRKVAFPDALTATPCVADGRLYVAGYGGSLWALAWDSLRK
ncbi:MAG: PQQ-binding-like beta-propeller repeat protein, partial [Planctomycetota bacterium]